jgi:uncharacterized membrane-anchored protein
MNAARKTLFALGAVALAQTAVLAWMVIDRVQLIKTGREIVLPIVPVDPRDLFRGEYVRLGFPINRVEAAIPDDTPFQRNAWLYIVLEKSGEDDWRAVEASRTLLHQDNPSRIVLKARLLWREPVQAPRFAMVRYGIESYFVPEGEGRKLEALAGQKKLAALVAVDKAGNAAIKGLIIDGKLQYDEPLF